MVNAMAKVPPTSRSDHSASRAARARVLATALNLAQNDEELLGRSCETIAARRLEVDGSFVAAKDLRD